jgi:glucose/arabinose dehydrogenase
MRHRQTSGRWLLAAALASAAVLMSSAQGTPQVRNPRVVTVQGPESFVSRVVADKLAAPWEVTWGPDGFLWITERVGKRVTRVNPTDGSRTVAVTIDEVYQTLAQDGLLGLALHPDLLKSRGTVYVYVAYTYDADPGGGVDRRMKVRRYTYEPSMQRLSSPVDILARLPHGTDHGGGRMVFGPDGKLYLSRGDHGATPRELLRSNHTGSPDGGAGAGGRLDRGRFTHQRRRIDPTRQSDHQRRSQPSFLRHITQGLAFDGQPLGRLEHGEASTTRSTSCHRAGTRVAVIAGYQMTSRKSTRAGRPRLHSPAPR